MRRNISSNLSAEVFTSSRMTAKHVDRKQRKSGSCPCPLSSCKSPTGEAPGLNGLSIELSPFTFPHSPSRIFTGSKRTSLLTLDLRTGQQLDCYASSAANFSELYEDDECLSEKEQLLRKLEGHGRSDSDTLLVGRADYRLTIHSPATTSGALTSSLSSVSSNDGWAAPGVQEIAYSTYTPNSYDRPLAEFWAKAGLAEQMWDETGVAKRVRVELGHDGVAVSVERGGGFKWMTDLGSIGYVDLCLLHPALS